MDNVLLIMDQLARVDKEMSEYKLDDILSEPGYNPKEIKRLSWDIAVDNMVIKYASCKIELTKGEAADLKDWAKQQIVSIQENISVDSFSSVECQDNCLKSLGALQWFVDNI